MSKRVTSKPISGPIPDSTTTQNQKTKNLPWLGYREKWYQIHKGKDLQTIARDELTPSLCKVCEIRDSPASPAQVSLQASLAILNKGLPDKIESSNLSMSVDINRLFEYWTALNKQLPNDVNSLGDK